MAATALPALAGAASTASSTASTTPAAATIGKKPAAPQDPLLAIVTKLSDSIAVVNAKIDALENTDADVTDAQKFIENARSGLNSVKISLALAENASSASATSTIAASAEASATSTDAVTKDFPKTRDERRKEAKDDLISVYKNVLAAIAALKKAIVLERIRLEIPQDSETIAPAASTTGAVLAPAARPAPSALN